MTEEVASAQFLRVLYIYFLVYWQLDAVNYVAGDLTIVTQISTSVRAIPRHRARFIRQSDIDLSWSVADIFDTSSARPPP
jgi:hypothetical protein